jgi:hypothetical protein
MQVPPLPGCTHEYVRKAGTSGSACGYCSKACYWYCRTCEDNGLGRIHVCGPKCKGTCRADHAAGKELSYGSWQMSAEGRAAIKRGRNSRGQEGGDGDDEDNEEPMGPISPSARRTQRRSGR